MPKPLDQLAKNDPERRRRMRKRMENFEPRTKLSIPELLGLERARKDAGLDMKAVARRLRITVAAFNNYESGLRRPPTRILLAWRRVLREAQR